MVDESIVLVITPSPDMINKIQQALNDIGGYILISRSRPTEALELAQKSIIDACILDIFHPDFPVLTVVKELSNNQPEMRLILLLSNHGLSHQDISGIIPDGFLPRSFNTGQLLSALGRAPKNTKIAETSAQQPAHTITDPLAGQLSQVNDPPNPLPFSRTQDFTNLSQRLSNLSTETTALALIILRRKQLLSHAGRLPYTAIQEIVDLINSYSRISAENLQKEVTLSHQKSGNGDMIRFVQLQSIQGKYLLYVISLTKDMLLALVFEQETQFSKVRRQTALIAHELLTPQSSAPLQYRTSSPEIGSQRPSQPSEAAQRAAISDLLRSQPAPPVTTLQTELSSAGISEATSLEVKPAGSDMEESGSIYLPSAVTSETGIEESGVESNPMEQGKQIGYHDSAEFDDQLVGEPLDFVPTGEEQSAQKDSGDGSITASAPNSFGNYITYSCLLIPRMPQHLLTSNLASYLFKWMGQLCLAYGWRLEHLSIHSNYIQMIAGAPLTISPAFLVRTLRQKTSQYIFAQFPPLVNENPSGDFWAPGFFISGGKQSIQTHLIDRYINEIRKHQGVYNSS
jgi:DNA-binding NarL/FixJ family response regulator/REP element-mobilizing transposase RayT